MITEGEYPMRLDAEKLEAAIADKGMSQAELARKLGMTAPTLNGLIRRAREGQGCHPATPKKLAKVLGVRGSSLIASDIEAARA